MTFAFSAVAHRPNITGLVIATDAQHARGNAGYHREVGHVFHDDGACADDRPLADGHAGQDGRIRADIGLGRGKATVWTCDLTKEYVAINRDYRS